MMDERLISTDAAGGLRVAAVVVVAILAHAALGTATLAAVLLVLIGLGLVAYSLHEWSRRSLAHTLDRFHTFDER